MDKQFATSKLDSILRSVEERGLSVDRHPDGSASIIGGMYDLSHLSVVERGSRQQPDYRLEVTLDMVMKPKKPGDPTAEMPKAVDVTRERNEALIEMFSARRNQLRRTRS